MPTQQLIAAIGSNRVRETLETLNEHFYNRKQEEPIRDAVLISLRGENNGFHALSEYPKVRKRHFDLSIWNANDFAHVEFKHQYPGDFTTTKVLNEIEDDLNKGINFSDFSRTSRQCIVRDFGPRDISTTHFVLILHSRPVQMEPAAAGYDVFMDKNEARGFENFTQLIDDNHYELCDEQPIRHVIPGERLSSIYDFYIYVRN